MAGHVLIRKDSARVRGPEDAIERETAYLVLFGICVEANAVQASPFRENAEGISSMPRRLSCFTTFPLFYMGSEAIGAIQKRLGLRDVLPFGTLQ